MAGRPAARSWAGVALGRLSQAPGVVSNGLAERLSERRAAQRRLTLRRLAIVVGIAAAVTLVGYVVLASPLLALRSESVRVATTGPTVDPVLVVEALEPAAGTPLARLSMSALEESVEGVPGVRSASVRRAWPAGLAVDVVARVPVAAVPGAGQLALLDVDGVQVGDPVAAAPDGLPVVVVGPGSRAVDSLNAVLSVLGELPPELLAEIREAAAGSPDTVRLRLSDGSRVEWGSSELSALKVRVLEVLRQRPAGVYDVSAPSRPVTR